MNYQRHYNLLISKARDRNWTKDSAPVYVERHHIIPRCMGGTNSQENLIFLSYNEHCLAHLLLAKIHVGNYKLLCAAIRMYSAHRQRDNSGKIIEPSFLKEQHARAASLFFKGKRKPAFTEEHRTNLSKSHLGRKDTDITRKKKSESAKGRIVTEETRLKNRLARSRQTNGGDRSVMIFGVVYKSIADVERLTGISRFNIWRRIKLEKYTEYSYV